MYMKKKIINVIVILITISISVLGSVLLYDYSKILWIIGIGITFILGMFVASWVMNRS